MKNECQTPTVVIVGRPNVGKSTLFNRICGKRKAIESEISQTTIDRIYGEVKWNNKFFSIIDTAGLTKISKQKDIETEIAENVDYAINEATLILFVIDTNQIDSYDKEIARKLHKTGKKVILVANKADNQEREIIEKSFLSLGFGKPNFISAISGRGTGDLLDKISAELPKYQKQTTKDSEVIKVSIIGRPNVGKSTIINRISGKKRAIVSEIPGTTRDVNDLFIQHTKDNFIIMDTAGIRRRGKITEGVEKYSILRAIEAAKKSNVALVVIDAIKGLTNQDTHLVGLIKELGKSIILLVNKTDCWDKLPEKKQQEEKARFIHQLQNNLTFIPYCPLIFVSGLTGKNIKKILPLTRDIYYQRFLKIEHSDLKNIVNEAKENNQQFPIPLDFYQEQTNPPIFKLVVKNKNRVHFSHLRYLENFLRDFYPFKGTPIFIDLIEK